MADVKELLEAMKAEPYEMVEVTAPHTGTVEFVALSPGEGVNGPSGEAGEKPGSLLAYLERERNKKPIAAPLKGVVESINAEAAGKFVEAGTVLLSLRHYLTKDEVIEAILKKTLSLFKAPERAKYYFAPETDSKIKTSGAKSVTVRPGEEMFIVSKMKREAPLVYDGPEGNIYAVYFGFGETVDQGAPLIGVCPEDQLGLIQDVVGRVQAEWEEPEG